MSVRRICFKTNFGFISIKEENEKVISINFKKSNNLSPNKLLFRLKKNINEFFKKNIKNIKCPTRIIGNKNQKKVWHEIKKIKYAANSAINSSFAYLSNPYIPVISRLRRLE